MDFKLRSTNNLYVYLLLTLLLSEGLSKTLKCPEGYFESNVSEKCFSITPSTEKRGKTHYWSNEYCTNRPVRNGALASFHSAKEMAFVVTKISGYSNGFWIGLESNYGRKRPMWMDGSPLDYQAWRSTEDRNICSRTTSGVGYLKIRSLDQWSCTTSGFLDKGFICQAEMGEVYENVTADLPAPLSVCPSGYESIGGHCLRFDTGSVSWSDAVRSCSETGDHLVSIHDPLLNAALYLKSGEASLPLWLGLNTTYSPDNDYWVDGWPAYERYYDNLDINDTSSIGCVIMTKNMRWKHTDCGQTHSFACQIPTEHSNIKKYFGNKHTECPHTTNWTVFGGKCYSVVPVTFYSDIIDKCAATENPNLPGFVVQVASLHSDFESFLINRLIIKTARSGKHNTWIGLTKRPSVENPEWLDGSDIDYTNWNTSLTPKNMFGAFIDFDWSPGKWANATKYNAYNALCQTNARLPSAQPITIPPSTTPIPEYHGRCPRGWITSTLVPACYYFDVDGMYDWHSAVAKCQSIGGELVSLHSNQTETWLREQVFNHTKHYRPDPVWIGLHVERDALRKKFYKWVDGSQFDFDNLPSNRDRLYYECFTLLTDTFRWGNTYCNSDLGLICHTAKFFEPTVPGSDRKRDSNREEKDAEITQTTIVTLFSLCLAVIITALISVTLAKRFYYTKPNYSNMESRA